mmetsp:Transcript_1796/g.6034  ORF Transcript_1796/g.6034 Transcript_1796/m.6034 type:complete len:243 (+) Transcript_1796:362-1090(+)
MGGGAVLREFVRRTRVQYFARASAYARASRRAARFATTASRRTKAAVTSVPRSGSRNEHATFFSGFLCVSASNKGGVFFTQASDAASESTTTTDASSSKTAKNAGAPRRRFVVVVSATNNVVSSTTSYTASFRPPPEDCEEENQQTAAALGEQPTTSGFSPPEAKPTARRSPRLGDSNESRPPPATARSSVPGTAAQTKLSALSGRAGDEDDDARAPSRPSSASFFLKKGTNLAATSPDLAQ